MQTSDLARIIIHHDNLSNPIYVPLKPLSEMTGHHVLEYLQNVLNSHQELPLNQTFLLDVGTMELPRGGAFNMTRLTGPHNDMERKKSVIEIVNRDKICLAHAVAVCFARANIVTETEWREATGQSQRPKEELIIYHKKCPRRHFEEMTRRNISGENKVVKRLALAMCRRANVGSKTFIR